MRQYEQPITFAKESAELNDENLGVIATLAKMAKRCPMTEILIEDHTSTSGFGEAYPRFTGDANADLNRRIEIHLDWDLSRT